MGHIKKLLVSQKIKGESDIYKDFLSLEICENFHIHLRNLRLIFDKEEFEIFCKAVISAYKDWEHVGKPLPNADKKHKTLTPPVYLYSGKIFPTHRERSNDLQIEIQDSPWMPSAPEFIHIHYKSYRLDVSHNEFVELAEAFASALKEFKKWKGIK